MMIKSGNLGSRLRVARRAAGLTQVQLAKLVGLTQGQITSIERGVTLTSGSTAAIAEAVRCNALWLATGRGDPGLQDVKEVDFLADYRRLSDSDREMLREMTKRLLSGKE